MGWFFIRAARPNLTTHIIWRVTVSAAHRIRGTVLGMYDMDKANHVGRQNESGA